MRKSIRDVIVMFRVGLSGALAAPLQGASAPSRSSPEADGCTEDICLARRNLEGSVLRE